MVEDNFVLGDRRGNTVFILSYVIGKYITPGIVRVVIDVAISARDDTSGADGAKVMAFSEVVPADNLDLNISTLILTGNEKSNLNKLRLNRSGLVPTG